MTCNFSAGHWRCYNYRGQSLKGDWSVKPQISVNKALLQSFAKLSYNVLWFSDCALFLQGPFSERW